MVTILKLNIALIFRLVSLLILSFINFNCSSTELLRDNVLLNELSTDRGLELLGIEKYERNLNFISFKYYLRTELKDKLYDIELNSANLDTIFIDTSLVEYSLIVELMYRDIGLRKFKSAYVNGEYTEEVYSTVRKVSECSKYSIICTYDVQLEIFIPTIDFLNFNSTGSKVNMTTDSTSIAYSKIQLFISPEQFREQFIYSRLYEHYMIWNQN